MGDLWEDFLGPPDGTTPAAVIANKNIKVSSFESNANERKHYVNLSVLIKFFTKDVFYLNYRKFSLQSYVLDVY